MEALIIKSDRKTFGLEIKNDQLLVRVPRRATKRQIQEFISDHEDWIEKHMELARQRRAASEAVEKLSEEELKELTGEAKLIIPRRVAHYAQLVGVDYGRVTIRTQRTRWGSCSAAGNLNFNCLLLLAPMEVLDSVIVHELCHRKEMNHSRRFYDEIQKVFPEYRKCHRWLKEHGRELLSRIP